MASPYPGVAPPPPGVVPSLEHPQDGYQSLLIGWLVTSIVLSTFFFFMRMYGKVFVMKSVLREDITCAIAWLREGVKYGQGHHAWEVSPEDNSNMRKWLYAGTVVYCPASYFTKVTLLLIIARIFAVRPFVARGIYFFMALLFIAYFPIQMVKILVCNPIRAYWDTSVKGTCRNQTQLFYADISLAMITDLFILILPIPLTWNLEAPKLMKIKVMLLLGIGGIAMAVTTYRQVLAVHFMHSKDPTADFAVIIVTVLLELSIGLVCSCLPVFNMLAERWKLPQLFNFKFRKAKISDPPHNLTSIITIGKISNRKNGAKKRSDTDLDGCFERLEDRSLQGSTVNLNTVSSKSATLHSQSKDTSY
ncbi:hypothetical protein NLG97_g5395 [Lecanicillium saksenae]|uniref:Uncharacterized protein n=1 Tax=Lecanicillium saksenae TaxID=468837 RepID=A0ACC1QVS9_9HYPO|nr:hypothetical protein NLG97_g5395 [Lecanicillium saksenae]